MLTAVLLAAASAVGPFSTTLLEDEKFWGDGKAEYSLYDAVEIRYGTPRSTEVRHILVRESFAVDAPVKADDWQAPGTYPVIKLNQIIRVPTGSYRYDQMLSHFWKAAGGDLRKFSLASIDSCGNTYKEGRIADDTLAYEARTYWEGMDRVDESVALPDGALFTDELPFKLRLIDWDRVTEFAAPLAPSVVSSRAEKIEFQPAKFTVAASPDGWKVTVNHANGTDELVFETAKPHCLKSWQRADGSSLKLKSSTRLDYWNHHQPGDEALLVP